MIQNCRSYFRQRKLLLGQDLGGGAEEGQGRIEGVKFNFGSEHARDLILVTNLRVFWNWWTRGPTNSSISYLFPSSSSPSPVS